MDMPRKEPYRHLSQLARRRWRVMLLVCLATLAAFMAASAGDRGRLWLARTTRPDDLWKYQSARFTSLQAADANSLILPDGTRVRLLATIPPREPDFARPARQRLGEIVAGREILLRIEPQSARDASGQLLAHAYVDDRNIAIDLLKQGFLRVDRNCPTPYRDAFIAAEDSARRKHLGLWMQMSPVRK